MNKLLHEDMVWCLRRLPKPVFSMLIEAGDSLMLAGGFIRACIAHEKLSDVDLFSKNKEQAELYARRYSEKYGRIIKTDNAFTVVERGSIAVQFIHRWEYEKPEDVLPSFDFTIARAMIWYDGEKWNSLCDDRYYADLATKRLVYCCPKRIEEVGGSMLRVLKFYQLGYRIPLDSLAKVISRLFTGVDLNAALQSGIGQVSDEERIAFVISGLLREVDPAVDPTHESHLPEIDKPEEINF